MSHQQQNRAPHQAPWCHLGHLHHLRHLLIWLAVCSLSLLSSLAMAATSTSTQISSSNSQLYPGQSTSLTATVSPSAATGTVTFKDGNTTMGSGTLSNGTASYSATFTSTGTHTLTAVYGGDSNYAGSTSGQYSQVVNSPVQTNLVLQTGSSTATVGQTMTLTAQLNPSSATGSITFKDGSTTIGTAALSSGTATLSYTFSSTGNHSLSASYPGMVGYTSATASATTVSVSLNTSSTSLSSSASQIYPGQSSTLTATVSPSSASGTITFKDGSATLGTGTLSNGTASLSASFTSTGTHTLTAVYGGNSSYAGSTSNQVSEVVNSPQSSSTSLSASPTTANQGQSVTLTAKVNPTAASGTVNFMDGSTTLGSATLSGGTASYTTSFSTSGSHSLTAVYAGVPGYSGSTSSAVTETIKAASVSATTTALSSSVNPSTVGGTTTLTATVSPSSATGTVTFLDGSTTLGTGTLSSGVATYSASFSSTGSHGLTAVYAGSGSYSASTSAAVTQTVNLASSSTTLTSSANPSTVGGATILTATVSPSSATGTVTFMDGTTTLGTGTLSSGVASYSASFGTTGSHSLTAVYAGSGSYSASTSAAVTQTVNLTSSSTTLTSSANPSTVGGATTLTATVSPSSATGTVTFLDGTTTLGTGTLSSGVATYSASFSTAGAHSLTAAYAGSSTSAASTSAAVTQTVNLASTTTTLTAAANPVQAGQSTTLTATVTPSSATGTVTFLDGTTALGTGTISSGVATYSANFGVVGTHSLTAVYGGSSTNATSTSAALSEAVSYDVAGNLSIRTDSRGVQGNYSYDPLNRLTNVAYSLAGYNTQSYQWTYDQTGAGFSNGIGRLTTASFPEGSTSYAYNAQGQVTNTSQTVNPVSGGNTVPVVLNTAYGYNPAGRLASVTYPSGNQISISYAAGLPTTVSFTASGSTTTTPLMGSIQYAPFGDIQSWNWAMNSGPVPHTRVFDTNGRLIRYPVGAYLQDITYDAAGRITQYTHYLAASGATTGAAAPALDQSFSYDNLGHLTQAVTTPTTWAFSYDANGNRTSTTVNGGTPNAYTIDSASNKLMAIATPAMALNYDAMGNTLSDNNYTLSYDLRGRLATLSFSGNPATVYTYNNDGLRVRKVNQSNGAIVLYAYDPQGHLIGEYDLNGNPIREYAWLQDMPVAVITPGANGAAPQVFYVHADHLNTPRAVLDQNNVPRWTWYSEPFGTTAANSNPSGLGTFVMNLRFPGQVYDAESGMHYNWHRSYVPGMGRYAESDPIGLNGGQPSTYSYVGGNPLDIIDPRGLQAVVSMPTPFGPVPIPLPLPISGGIPPYIPAPSGPSAICLLAPLLCALTNIGPSIPNWVFNRPGKTPNSGEPGSCHVNPGSGQQRGYGDDGLPDWDVDWDQHHGPNTPVPHGHDWGRDSDGRPVRGGPIPIFGPWPLKQ